MANSPEEDHQNWCSSSRQVPVLKYIVSMKATRKESPRVSEQTAVIHGGNRKLRHVTIQSGGDHKIIIASVLANQLFQNIRPALLSNQTRPKKIGKKNTRSTKTDEELMMIITTKFSTDMDRNPSW
jgi:hypothetical protein